MIEKIIFGENKPKTLYSDIAEEAAKYIQHKGNKNNSTQLRKFYDEVVRFNNKIQFKGSKSAKALAFDNILPEIKKLKSQASYAFSRDLIDDKYLAVFNHCIDCVEDPVTLKEVKSFFEAMMGYYKYYEKLDEIQQEKERLQRKNQGNFKRSFK